MSTFRAHLAITELAQSYARGFDRSQPVDVHWTVWIDPGTHTGLAAVTYAHDNTGRGQAEIAEKFNGVFQRTKVGTWNTGAGIAGHDTKDLGLRMLTGSTILAIYTETLYEEDEKDMVLQAMARVRKLGALAGGPFWDAEPPEPGSKDEWCGLGAAGVGAEMFFNLRAERGHDYLSPVRVRSMFEYALADEFGIAMSGQTSADALKSFSDIRMKGAGAYIPGPDHERAALAHALLAIRKQG